MAQTLKAPSWGLFYWCAKGEIKARSESDSCATVSLWHI